MPLPRDTGESGNHARIDEPDRLAISFGHRDIHCRTGEQAMGSLCIVVRRRVLARRLVVVVVVVGL